MRIMYWASIALAGFALGLVVSIATWALWRAFFYLIGAL